MVSSFARLDTMLTERGIRPLSLHPHRHLATSFSELGEVVGQSPNVFPPVILFRDALKNILEAIFTNFPENIFWDFDFFVASMLKQASTADRGGHRFLQEFDDKVVSLMKLFGSQSNIRFRYLHDFMYGFDWAKWVQKEPQSHQAIGPFSLKFLDYLLGRGHEILRLIAEHDYKYHQLGDNSYRNPFGFSREPKDESYLLTCLAEKDLIPVATWNTSASPIWNKPFYQAREAISQKLRLSKDG